MSSEPSSNRFSSLLLEGLDHYRRGRMMDAVRSWEEAYLLEPTNLRAREFLRSALERIHARMSSNSAPAQPGVAFQEMQQLVPNVPLEHLSGPGVAFRSFERHPWLRPPGETTPGMPALKQPLGQISPPVLSPEAASESEPPPSRESQREVLPRIAGRPPAPPDEVDDAPAVWEPKGGKNATGSYDLGLELAQAVERNAPAPPPSESESVEVVSEEPHPEAAAAAKISAPETRAKSRPGKSAPGRSAPGSAKSAPGRGSKSAPGAKTSPSGPPVPLPAADWSEPPPAAPAMAAQTVVTRAPEPRPPQPPPPAPTLDAALIRRTPLAPAGAAPPPERAAAARAPSPWDDGPSVAIPVSDPPAIASLNPLWKIHGEPKPAPAASDETAVWMTAADELMALDDFSGALELVNKVLALHPEHARAQSIKATCEQNLLQMYESRLGGMARRPRVVLSPDEVIWLNLDPRAGFVLAQIDGTVSFEDLYAICGLTHLDTARILSQLLDEGVIEAVGELNHLF